jgi:hypothetical protein
MATRTTDRPAEPMAFMIGASKTRRPPSEIATVRPEKMTVRPAESTVRAVAATICSRVISLAGTPCALARSSSRNRLTVSSP